MVAKIRTFPLAFSHTMTNNTNHTTSRRGFTLVELLVVISIIAVLLGIGFPIYNKIIDNAKKKSAQTCATQLVQACESFYEEYYYLPMANNNNAQDNQQRTNNQFMPALVGLQVALGDNPKKLKFFEFQLAEGKGDAAYNGLDRSDNRAELLGPWLNPSKDDRYYWVMLNYDGDNQIRVPNNIGSEILFDRRVIVYHKGKDGKAGGEYNDDNVYSWNKND